MASYPITDIEGIEAETAARLKAAGIRTTGRLLEAARNPKGRRLLAEQTGYDELWLRRERRLSVDDAGAEAGPESADARRSKRRGAAPCEFDSRLGHRGRPAIEVDNGP